MRHFKIKICKKNKYIGMGAGDIFLVPGGGHGDTVLNVMHNIKYVEST